MIIPISVFQGGTIRRYSDTGVEYTERIPIYTLPGTKNTTLTQLINAIYSHMGYTQDTHKLAIQARWNVAPTGVFWDIIAINSEETWQAVLQTALGSNYRCIHVYVEFTPVGRERRRRPNVLPNFNYMTVQEPSDEEDEEDEDYEDEGEPGDNSDPEPCQYFTDKEMYVTGQSSYGSDLSDRLDDDDSDNEDFHPACPEFLDISGLATTQADFFKTKKYFKSPLAVGQFFNSKNDLQEAVKNFSIHNNAEIYTVNSNKKYIQYKCKDPMCKWSLYATSAGQQWIIKTQDYTHICIRAEKDHRQLTAKMIALKIKDALERDLKLSLSAVESIIRAHYPNVMKPNYGRLWAGREEAMAMLFGSWEEAYSLLPRYLKAVQNSNPGTEWAITHENHTDPQKKYFKCAAWAFSPCILASRYCRPVLTIDASFLSGRYGGRLLVCCMYDANQNLVPIAFGLVKSETKENWGWFMHWLRTKIFPKGKYCVISDRHLAIKAVMQSNEFGWDEENGECAHRYCSQHISENLYRVCSNHTVIDLFKWTVRKTKDRKYHSGLQAIKLHSKPAWQYLIDIGKARDDDPDETAQPYRWAQCKDSGWRYGIMTSNGAKSLNNIFKGSRRQPVLCVVQDTFHKCVEWFDARRVTARKLRRDGAEWSTVITKMLRKRIKNAARNRVQTYDTDNGVYVVKTQGERIGHNVFADFEYTVHIDADENVMPTCDCRKPQLTALPCSHVMTVCQLFGFNFKNYIHPYYSIDMLCSTWAPRFHPVANQVDWPEIEGPKLIPHPSWVFKGRRSHKRKKMTMDEMEYRVPPIRGGHRRRSAASSRRNDGAGTSSSQQNRGATSSSQRGSRGRGRQTVTPEQRAVQRETASWMLQQSWCYGSNAESGWGQWTPPERVTSSSQAPSSSQQPPWTRGFDYFFGSSSQPPPPPPH